MIGFYSPIAGFKQAPKYMDENQQPYGRKSAIKLYSASLRTPIFLEGLAASYLDVCRRSWVTHNPCDH